MTRRKKPRTEELIDGGVLRAQVRMEKEGPISMHVDPHGRVTLLGTPDQLRSLGREIADRADQGAMFMVFDATASDDGEGPGRFRMLSTAPLTETTVPGLYEKEKQE